MTFRTLSILAALTLAFALAPQSAFAKKKPAADTSSTKDDKDDDKDEDAAETHKARAKEFANGKPLDKEKTRGQVDKLTGQVSDLEKKMKAKGELPADEPTSTKKKKVPATKPSTDDEPVAKKKKTPADKSDKDKTEASAKSDK